MTCSPTSGSSLSGKGRLWPDPAFILGLGGVATAIEGWETPKRLPKGGVNEIRDQRFAKSEICEADYIRAKHLLLYGPPLELPDWSE